MKTHQLFFLKKTKFWTFWEILLFQSHSSANLQHSAIFGKSNFFSENPSFFLKKKNKLWTLWEISLFQCLATAKLLPLAILKKLKILFRKIHLIFLGNPNFERFENSYSSSRILRKFASLVDFKKTLIFFENSIYFLTETQNFECFGKSYFLSCILQLICCFQRFLKKNQDFLSENQSDFLKKTQIFLTSWEILLFQSLATANLLPLGMLKKLKIFFRKIHLIFLGNPNFERFENSYSSSRILQQICYHKQF